MWIRFHVECTFTELVRQEWGGGIFLPVCSLLTGVLRGLSSCSCSPALGLGWECTVCMVVSKPCVSDVFLAVVLSLDGYFGSILRVALELQSWASSFHWFGKHLVLCMKSLSATRSRPRLLFPVLKRDWHTLNQNRFSPSQQPRWVVKGWSLLIRDMWFCRVGPSGCPTSTLPHRGRGRKGLVSTWTQRGTCPFTCFAGQNQLYGPNQLQRRLRNASFKWEVAYPSTALKFYFSEEMGRKMEGGLCRAISSFCLLLSVWFPLCCCCMECTKPFQQLSEPWEQDAPFRIVVIIRVLLASVISRAFFKELKAIYTFVS